MLIIARYLLIAVSILLFSACGGERITDTETTIFADVSDTIYLTAQGMPKPEGEQSRYVWQYQRMNSKGVGYEHPQILPSQGSKNLNLKLHSGIDLDFERLAFLEVYCLLKQASFNGSVIAKYGPWEIKESRLEHSPSNGGVFIRNANDVTALEGLTSISGNLTINNLSFDISEVHSDITDVGGDVIIEDNDALTSLSLLENLQSIGGDLTIKFNLGPMSLSGLEDLQSIGGDLTIRNNPELTSLSGLEGLQSIGGVSIHSLPGQEEVQLTYGDFTIISNSKVCDSEVEALLDQIENQGGVGGDVQFSNNLLGC